MTIIGFTSNPSALLLQLTETSVIAKQIVLPRASPYFQILDNKQFDFGWENNILVICNPITSNNEFELLFPSMLPHATTGDFFILLSILDKQDGAIIAGTLGLKDYATVRKNLRVRRNNKYLPIIWKEGTNEADKIEENSSN